MLLSDVPEIHGRSDAGVSATSSGQAPPTATIATPPASSERTRAGDAARRHPQPGDGERGDDEQRRAHLRLEAEADADAREDDPARPAVLQRADHRPQRADDAEHEQRVRVVVARDRDRDRRQRQHGAGHEAARAAEAPAREVIDEPDSSHAHQRLRHEHAQRVVAEGAHGQRLHPQRERRLVHRHHAADIERSIEERVPARGHRAHCAARSRCWRSRSGPAPTGSARRRPPAARAARAGGTKALGSAHGHPPGHALLHRRSSNSCHEESARPLGGAADKTVGSLGISRSRSPAQDRARFPQPCARRVRSWRPASSSSPTSALPASSTAATRPPSRPCTTATTRRCSRSAATWPATARTARTRSSRRSCAPTGRCACAARRKRSAPGCSRSPATAAAR